MHHIDVRLEKDVYDANNTLADHNAAHLKAHGVRAFDLLGNHRLGSRFWYPEMAEQLLARQGKTGFWDSASTHKPRGVLDTSFALLFLQRSTRIIEFPSLTDPSDTPPADQRGK